MTNGEHGLPAGWNASTLGAVCTVNPRRADFTDVGDDTLVTFVPMAAVNADLGRIDQARERPFHEVRRGYTTFTEGDVLFAKITPCMENGKAAVARNLAAGIGFGSTEFHVLRPSDAVFSEFLLRYVRQKAFRRRAEDTMTGSVGQLRVPPEFLESAPILVPPKSVQTQILRLIDEAQAQVDLTMSGLQRVRTILSKFQQALLASACSGRLTRDWRAMQESTESVSDTLARIAAENGPRKTRRGVVAGAPIDDQLAASELPESWALRTVGDLLVGGALVDVKDGNHGANHPKTREFTAEGTPFIMAAHIVDFSVKYDRAPKISGAALDRIRVGFAQSGDVILTHKGTVGRVAVNERECVLTPQTTYYRPSEDVVDPGYLAWYLASPQLYGQLAAVMSQTTRDFVPISDQYRLTVVIPPLLEQREIDRQVRMALEIARATERATSDASQQLDQALDAIVAKAFRGELVRAASG